MTSYVTHAPYAAGSRLPRGGGSALMRSVPGAAACRAIARGALIWALALTLAGCAQLESQVIGRYMRSAYAGQPVVNALEFSESPRGGLAVTSVWYVAGPESHRHQPLASLRGPQGPAQLGLSFWAPQAARDRVQALLDAPAPDCPSLNELTAQAMNEVGALFAQWYGPGFALAYRLVVLPPVQGGSGVHLSRAQPGERPELMLATALFESPACVWRRHWAFALASTVLHESVHVHTRLTRPQPLDALRDEFAAYAGEECLFARFYGPDETRERSFPGGLDEVGFARVMAAADAGEVPHTIAGRLLAYRWWHPAQGRAPTAVRPDCQRLIADYPNPREIMQ